MDLQTFINQVLATNKPVGTGECGELVDLYLVEVFGNYTAYNDAIDYWNNGIPGFVKVSSPQPGDIVVYNAHPGFPAGHIAIYNGNGQVFEQNADPDGSLPHLFNRATTYLLGYLREEISMGVTIQGTPASVSWGNNRIDVFAHGSDNGLWHKWYGSSWSGWERVGDCASSPSVASWGADRLDIFFTGVAGDLVHLWYDGKFNGPESLGQPE